MSSSERLVQLAQEVPEQQATIIFFMIKNYLESLDDAFCLTLDDAYEADPEKGGGVPIEELAARLGVVLE